MPASDEEKEQYEQLLSEDYPEEAARWYEMAALAGRTDALEILEKLHQ